MYYYHIHLLINNNNYKKNKNIKSFYQSRFVCCNISYHWSVRKYILNDITKLSSSNKVALYNKETWLGLSSWMVIVILSVECCLNLCMLSFVWTFECCLSFWELNAFSPFWVECYLQWFKLNAVCHFYMHMSYLGFNLLL